MLSSNRIPAPTTTASNSTGSSLHDGDHHAANKPVEPPPPSSLRQRQNPQQTRSSSTKQPPPPNQHVGNGNNSNNSGTQIKSSVPHNYSPITSHISPFIIWLFKLLMYPLMLLYRRLTGTDQLLLAHPSTTSFLSSSLSPISSSSAPPSTSLSQLRSLSPNLTMPILILDLDETLLHSSLKIPEPQHAHLYQYSLNVYIDNVPVTFYVSERPYLKNFMKKVCDWYQVVIFTASVRQYAGPVIDRLYYSDRITARYFRESCSQYEGMFIKDLKTVCGHSGLSRCVILDNSPISYMWNKENAIPCEAWMGENENDTELLNLLPFLDALRYTTDVRNVLRLRLGYP